MSATVCARRLALLTAVALWSALASAGYAEAVLKPLEVVCTSKLASSANRLIKTQLSFSMKCRDARAAIQLVKTLAPVLLHAGFSWVVFTGADTVMNVFRHLKLEPHVLCAADPLLLGEERHAVRHGRGGRAHHQDRAEDRSHARRPGNREGHTHQNRTQITGRLVLEIELEVAVEQWNLEKADQVKADE